mgnify:CR=1 FL=1
MSADNFFELTEEQSEALVTGNMYVNVHSLDIPAGEVRGQLLPQINHFPDETFISQPEDGQQVVVEGLGSTILTVEWLPADDPDGNKVHYIYELASDSTFTSPMIAANVGTGTMFSLTFQQIDSILELAEIDVGGSLTVYHRINTSDGSLVSSGFVSSAELVRGVVTTQPTEFMALLSGSNEVPPVLSTGFGEVMAHLSGDTLWVSGSFSELTSDFNADIAGGSHLHVGLAGENGGVELPLNATVDGDKRGGSFEQANNMFVLSDSQKTLLLQRKLYVNIHTVEFPAGEIRGQLAPAADYHFRANLHGSNEAPPVFTQANGALLLELHSDTLVVSGRFQELDSDYNLDIGGGSHIHLAYAGSNGGVEIPLNQSLDDDNRGGVYNALDNKFVLTTDQMTALMERRLYVNIHSVNNPAGAIRGQIVPQTARALLRAAVSGTQEVPPVKSGGNGAFLVEFYGDSIKLSGSFQGLESDMNVDLAGGSHLHLAPAGSNGDVVIPLNVTLADNNRDGVYPVMDNGFAVTEDQVTALMNRMMYANIHSLDNPAGEIRGQVVPEGYAFLTAWLSGMNEVPPVETEAYGGVIAEFTNNNLVLTGSFNDLGSGLNVDLRGGAHIHTALPYENGPIAVDLGVTLPNGDMSGRFMPADNSFELTEEQRDALVAANMYVNVHSLDIPGGEVRGQLLPHVNHFPGMAQIKTPADGAEITIEGDSLTEFSATWTQAMDPDGNDVFYTWQVFADSALETVLLTEMVGRDSMFTTTYSAVDSLMQAVGVEQGQTVTLYHRVRSSDGSLDAFGEYATVELTRGTITEVKDQYVEVPTEFALNGNYPNPFNPSTTITFDLPNRAHVRMLVFDILGRQVIERDFGTMNAGFNQEINFDASSLSTGVYFYNLKINSETFKTSETGKMMLMR